MIEAGSRKGAGFFIFVRYRGIFMNKTIKVTMTAKLVRQAYLAQCGLDLIFIFAILAVCGLQAYVVWDYCGCMSASWLWYFLAYMVIPFGFTCSYGYAYFKTLRMIKDMK